MPDTRALVGKLKAVRKQNEGGSPEALRSALQEALRASLEGLPADQIDRTLAEARESLIGEARDLEARLERLEREAAALREERDRLAAAGTGGGSAAGDDILARMLPGFRKLIKGEPATPESLGVPGDQARFYNLVAELILFALSYEIGLQGLLSDIEVGPGGEMNTKMWGQQKKLIEKRFLACLDNEKGSIAALKEALARNSRFIIDLNKAYEAAVRQGPQTLLGELDPEPILGKSKGLLSITNYEAAWKSFVSKHTDLCNLTPSEMWESFFRQPFRERLADHLEPGEQE